jgi:hypothetical protein
MLLTRHAVSLFLALAAPGMLAAQGTVTGTVREDGSNRPLAGVEVLLEGSKKATQTNEAGQFTLTDLPTGNKVVLFRSIGFRPSRVRVIVKKNEIVTADAVLVSEGVRLDPLVVTGRPDAPRAIGGRESFEERRRLGFGKFMDSTELRRAGGVRVSDVLTRLGVSMYEVRGDAGLQLLATSSRRSGHSTDVPCYMSVIYDGVTLYKAVSTGGIPPFPPPDFRKEFELNNIESIEVYRGAGEVPLEFGGPAASCGVIVLWSKRGR